MNIQAEKIELVKRLLETEDIRIIAAIKSIFLGSKNSTDEWGNLPDLVIEDIKEAIQQIENGAEISHAEAQVSYKKWL